tara:strand:- start:1961 stop:2491 length:531 start_codon:yes stop_codon:yes gene_type:complete
MTTNLIEIAKPEDLITVATEMKISACDKGKKFKQKDQKPYSKTVEEANARAEELKDYIKAQMGQSLQCIMFLEDPGVLTGTDANGNKVDMKGFPVTLSLSAEILDEGEEWHLSISAPIMVEGQPSRVPDRYAEPINRAFFEGNGEEFKTNSAYKNVRHFRMKKEIKNGHTVENNNL